MSSTQWVGMSVFYEQFEIPTLFNIQLFYAQKMCNCFQSFKIIS